MDFPDRRTGTPVRLTPLVIAATSVALVAPTAAQADSPGTRTPAAPGVSVPGGRYEHSVELKFRAERGTTVRYTLDGTTPTRDSRVHSPGRFADLPQVTERDRVRDRAAPSLGCRPVPVLPGGQVASGSTATRPLARLPTTAAAATALPAKARATIHGWLKRCRVAWSTE